MTTTVRFNAPVNPVALLNYATELAGGDPEKVAAMRDDDKPGSLWNPCGIGLNAWCWVDWCPDGPLPTRSDWAEPEDENDPAGVVELTFDTTYGLRDDLGGGCGDLHAWMIRKVTAWVRERHPGAEGWWRASEYRMTPTRVGSFNGSVDDLSTHTGRYEIYEPF